MASSGAGSQPVCVWDCAAFRGECGVRVEATYRGLMHGEWVVDVETRTCDQTPTYTTHGQPCPYPSGSPETDPSNPLLAPPVDGLCPNGSRTVPGVAGQELCDFGCMEFGWLCGVNVSVVHATDGLGLWPYWGRFALSDCSPTAAADECAIEEAAPQTDDCPVGVTGLSSDPAAAGCRWPCASYRGLCGVSVHRAVWEGHPTPSLFSAPATRPPGPTASRAHASQSKSTTFRTTT